jgi:hypothetical protein
MCRILRKTLKVTDARVKKAIQMLGIKPAAKKWVCNYCWTPEISRGRQEGAAGEPKPLRLRVSDRSGDHWSWKIATPISVVWLATTSSFGRSLIR